MPLIMPIKDLRNITEISNIATEHFNLPEDIQAIVGGKEYSLNHVGMSDSEVRIYDDFVLKIQPQSEETDHEYAITKWIGNQIPIPSISGYCAVNGMAYTLMTKMDGKGCLILSPRCF